MLIITNECSKVKGELPGLPAMQGAGQGRALRAKGRRALTRALDYKPPGDQREAGGHAAPVPAAAEAGGPTLPQPPEGEGDGRGKGEKLTEPNAHQTARQAKAHSKKPPRAPRKEAGRLRAAMARPGGWRMSGKGAQRPQTPPSDRREARAPEGRGGQRGSRAATAPIPQGPATTNAKGRGQTSKGARRGAKQRGSGRQADPSSEDPSRRPARNARSPPTACGTWAGKGGPGEMAARRRARRSARRAKAGGEGRRRR